MPSRPRRHRLSRSNIGLMGLLVMVQCSGSAVTADDPPVPTDEPRRHWSFQPLARPALPPVANPERVRTPVDTFVLARLQAKRLDFSPDAERAVLMRRVYLDLIGLPPSPDELDEYLADDAPDAYERLLDRLLDSPHFGQRWGRHWLDVAGYVDCVGFEIDPANVILAEGKWLYRDYVIRSLNQDKPYDRFITEQLAGDELVDWRGAAKFTPEIRELLVATGFLRTAEDDTHEPESNIPLVHHAVLHDTLEIVGSSLLALTLNCARCHSHKFDPIPHEDYYRLMALFTPAYNPQNWKAVYPHKADGKPVPDRALPDVSPAELSEIERHNGEIDRQVAECNDQLAALRRPHEARLLETKLAALPEAIRADTKAALETPADKRNEVQKYLAGKFEAALKAKPEEVVAALDDSDKATNQQITERIQAANGRRRTFGKIQALYDVGPPPATSLLVRGEHQTPGPEVQPGFLSVLSDADGANLVPASTPNPQSSGRRTALARWLTERDTRAEGLLARVVVNRIWQHLFGEGIVPTPDNFGHAGQRPTHPELLEWLTSEFVANGWRMKPLVKLMMCSTGYRQSSAAGPVAGQAVDPGNELLWRMRLRRLDSEVIRDAMLAASGKLDPTMDGPPVPQEARPDGMVVVPDKAQSSPTAKYRRSIYLLHRRKYPVSVLKVFDQPVIATNCTRRDASAVPLQSLMMLNDPFVQEQSEHFAERVARSAGDRRESQIELAFRLALARMPTAAESQWCTEHWSKQADVYRASGLPADQADRKALLSLCQTLLNTSEFLYAH